jgi:hypothetical protein
MSEKLLIEIRGIDNATAPLKAVQAQVARTTASINNATAGMRGFAQNSSLANTSLQKWAKGSLQQAGFQVGDFAVQVANGTNSLQAFGQQAPQLLQIFGPAGAVIGAAVAIIAALGVVAQKTGKDLSSMGSALGVLQEPVFAVVTALKELGAMVRSVFGGMAGQIDTLLIFVGLLALRFVALRIATIASTAAMASSAAVTQYLAYQTALAGRALLAHEVIMLRAKATAIALAGTFKALGAVMMRFLPIAALLVAAKLIEYFLALKKGAGSFGEALSLLKDVAYEVFQRISFYSALAISKIGESWAGFQSIIYEALQGALQNIYSWGNSAVGVFRGAFDAVKAIWGLLPSAIGDFAMQAANALVQGVESMLNAVVQRVNYLISGLNSALSMLPDWAVGEGGIKMNPVVEIDLPDLTNKFSGAATAVGDAASKAFKDAMSQTYFETPDMSSMSGAAKERVAAYQEAANMLGKAVDRPMTAWQSLQAAVAAGTEEVNIFGDASAAAADKAGGAAKKAVEELTPQQENMKSIASTIRDAFSGAFMSMVDGTKSVKDAFKDMARSIILKLYEVLVVQRIVNGAMGLVGKVFPSLAPFVSGARAMGGPVTGGKAYLVGERGPEIVVPSRNGQVVPNNQMGGNNVTVNQSISFGAGVTRAEIQAMLPKIVESTKAAVFDAQRRSVNGMGY